MALLSPAELQLWVGYVEYCPLNFKIFGLMDIIRFCLKEPKVQVRLLTEMRKRWLPETRSFHFGDRQICPTVEEFRAILMVEPNTTLLHLRTYEDSPSLKKILMAAPFEMSKNSAELILKNSTIDLPRWHQEHLEFEDIPFSDSSLLLSVVVLLAHWFVRPTDGKPSAKILDMARMLHQGKHDPSGIILAETLLGLDEPCREPHTDVGGSPIVLYIWALEKLHLMQPVPTFEPFNAQVLFERVQAAKQVEPLTEEQYLVYVQPWYDIPKMARLMNNQPAITIFGLERITCYYTTTIYRQFCLHTMISDRMSQGLQNQKVNMKWFRTYLQRWKDATYTDMTQRWSNGLEEYLRSKPRRPVQPPPPRIEPPENSKAKRRKHAKK